jgi:Zn-dependent protease/CBS domain-containing protein
VFTHRIPIFKLLGFQVWIDWSWFILAVLITWSLAAGLFPALFKDEQLSTATLWSMGVAGALGLFVCIVLHELGHSVVARRYGVQMSGITLFVFGGVAEMTDEPSSATAEFFMAIGGPIVSVVLGVCLLIPTMLGIVDHWPVAVLGVTGWLGWINLVLVGFNLIPAFPLDGGRMLRAGLWHWKKDLRWATQITCRIGGAFGIALIAFGVLNAVLGNLIGGIWWFVLGLFLRGAARMSYRQVLLRRALEGEPVERFMRREPVSVAPDLSVHDLVENFVYRHQYKMYPVVDHGRLLGCVMLSAIKDLPREQWSSRRVGDIMCERSKDNTVTPDSDAMQALSTLNRTRASRLMVADDGHLAGVLALKDVVGFLSMKIDLEGD